jgi:hypothetical protein
LELAVDGCARTSSPTLVVGKSVLGIYLSLFNSCVLSHYIHWCHTDPKNHCQAGEWDIKAVPVFDVFANEFLKEVWFGLGTLVVAKGESVKNVLFSVVLTYVNSWPLAAVHEDAFHSWP